MQSYNHQAKQKFSIETDFHKLTYQDKLSSLV